MTVKSQNDYRSSFDVIVGIIEENGGEISEELLYDKLAIFGFEDSEVQEYLEELWNNELIFRSNGKWVLDSNDLSEVDVTKNVGYRVVRASDGEKFVVALSGELSSLSTTDSEYISKESWKKGYVYGNYRILCFACLQNPAISWLKKEVPVCTSCAMHLANHFEIEDDVYIRELIYTLREDEDQISIQDINNVKKTWRIIDGDLSTGNRRLWGD